MSLPHTNIVKILYIAPGVDEKSASASLEQLTSILNYVCVFTVIQNIFTAIECTEHTAYDLIFIDDKVSSQFTPQNFANTLRSVGSQVPIVLIVNNQPTSDSNPNNEIQDPWFARKLYKPFTKFEFCRVITSFIANSYFESQQQEEEDVNETNPELSMSEIANTNIILPRRDQSTQHLLQQSSRLIFQSSSDSAFHSYDKK